MINLEELKPIIEPLLGENAAEIIEAIQAIDKEPEARVDEAVAEALKKNDEAWNQRFKDAFFKPVGNEEPDKQDNVADVISEEMTEDKTEEVNEDITVDDLFEFEEVK